MISFAINVAPIGCINHVAVVYHVPATFILSMIKKKGGKNGTFDYGIMEINQLWLPKIAAYGYTKEDTQYNACKNIFVDAWIISQHLSNNVLARKSIENYHFKTTLHNKKYRDDIYDNNREISMIINEI